MNMISQRIFSLLFLIISCSISYASQRDVKIASESEKAAAFEGILIEDLFKEFEKKISKTANIQPRKQEQDSDLDLNKIQTEAEKAYATAPQQPEQKLKPSWTEEYRTLLATLKQMNLSGKTAIKPLK